MRAMTAKQAVYQAYLNGNLDLKKLQEGHRSIQVRKVGINITQIRFRDSESWMTVEDFASNYRNKILKDLSDRLTSASKVLSPEELLNGLTDDCRRLVMRAASAYAISNQWAVSVKKYNDVVKEYNQQLTAKMNVESQLSEITTRLKECQQSQEASHNQIERMKRQMETRDKQLSQMKREIFDSAKFGMVSTTILTSKFSDYNV